ncbi:hypothetical protein LJC45_02190 [Alistipes sp. OttesenSCG-928-B03]|nr:hypothetical protein [Alistipes sp. OttesenSCG-928-B03]
MKKYLLPLVLLFVFAACKSGDDDPEIIKVSALDIAVGEVRDYYDEDGDLGGIENVQVAFYEDNDVMPVSHLVSSVGFDPAGFEISLPGEVCESYLVRISDALPGVSVSDPRARWIGSVDFLIDGYEYLRQVEERSLIESVDSQDDDYKKPKRSYLKQLHADGSVYYIFADRDVTLDGSCDYERSNIFYHRNFEKLNLSRGWNVVCVNESYESKSVPVDGVVEGVRRLEMHYTYTYLNSLPAESRWVVWYSKQLGDRWKPAKEA